MCAYVAVVLWGAGPAVHSLACMRACVRACVIVALWSAGPAVHSFERVRVCVCVRT